ncbi:MAG: TonB-dependent receptor [Prevotellaceae bacterium]|nr:TonB-dependent receptor [Prevotellaceae bacterium]
MMQVRIKTSVRLLALLFGLFLSIGASAQNVIRGHVKDATGEPVIGATVRIPGQDVGVITDFDGNFSIKANAGDKLQITYIGYKTMEVSATNNVVITLEDDTQVLENVVVIGYGVAKKKDLTGSVTAMKPDSKNKGLVVNAQDMIQGKIAGVSVISNDGAPGSGAQIRIRGGSSLNASNDPLIVIDGLAMDNDGVKGLSNPLAMVNPQDIESFSVLKDASATAIYGSRGSNGVIIITTKKGRKGQAPKVSYNGSFTVSTKKKTLDVLSGDEYRELIESMYGTDSDAYRALGTANTDWQDEIYRTAYSHDHNVTVSGALKNLPYRVSVGYTDQQGILKTSDFERVTAAINLNPSFLDDHLTLNLNGKGMYARSTFPNGDAISAAVLMDPTQDPYNYTSEYHKNLLGSNLNQTLQNFGGFFEWTSSGDALNDPLWPYTYNTNATKNPLAVLAESGEVAHSRSFVGSADIDYKVHGFEDLRLHMTLGADISKGRQSRDISGASPNYIYYGSHGAEEILKRNLSLSAYAQYYKDFNKDHHFDIMAGYEWQHFWRSQNNDYIQYYQSTNSLYPNEALEHTPYEYKTESYLVSFFGRANYIFKDRYYITATIRDDGSSRFKEHWAWFPSFAFAWRLKEENMLKDVNWLSDLKLRLGYGVTGQQAGSSIDDYNWIPTYSINTGTDSYYPVTGDGTLYRPDNYTPDLKWETTTTYNVGIDFGFLNQRITGSVDWYYRKTDDLLNYAPTATMSAYRNQAWQNIGSLENTGIEVALSWKAIQTKDWYWSIDYNFTYNHNEITDLSGVSSTGAPVANTGYTVGDGTGAYLMYNQEGYPINSFYVYQQVYDENGNPIENCVVDRNGDGQITEDDKYLYKSPAPSVTMGLSSRLEYKNWDFGFTLRASLGNYVFNGIEASNSNMNTGTVWSNSLQYLSNRLVSSVSRNWQTSETTAVLTDYYVRNASYLKCDNITLGYSFANLFKTGGWHGLSGRVYGTVSNVFTITKYDGIDPEVNSGYDNNMYPRPISFILGLSLDF